MSDALGLKARLYWGQDGRLPGAAQSGSTVKCQPLREGHCCVDLSKALLEYRRTREAGFPVEADYSGFGALIIDNSTRDFTSMFI
jgi:hypothetical protein